MPLALPLAPSPPKACPFASTRASTHHLVPFSPAVTTGTFVPGSRRGVTPEQLAAEVLEAQLPGDADRKESDPFARVGILTSDELRGRRVDELLAKGFGQSHS